MAKNVYHLQHIKSNVVENDKPKLPTSDVLVDGELAVNYASGYETISLKNSDSNITTFSSDDYYTKTKLGSGFTNENSGETVTNVIEVAEEVISEALNDLNDRIDNTAKQSELESLSESVIQIERTVSAAINDVKVNSANYNALAELAENVRLLTERVKALEEKA